MPGQDSHTDPQQGQTHIRLGGQAPQQSQPQPQQAAATAIAGGGVHAGGDASPEPGAKVEAADGRAMASEALATLSPMSGFGRHPRTSPVWKWWRPLLTIPLALAFFVAILALLMYGTAAAGIVSLAEMAELSDQAAQMDQAELFFSPFGAILMIGGLAGMSVAVALALWVSRERPFGTLLSVFDRLRWPLFARAVAFSFVTLGALLALETVIVNGGLPSPSPLSVEPWVIGALAVLLPLQCLAEEVVFRGYAYQTLACRLPAKVAVPIALVAQALLFTVGHTYGAAGQVAILFTGLVYGWLAERTGGLEASTAFHIANNMIVFVLMYLGMGSTDGSVLESAMDGAITIAAPVAFVLLALRRGWLDDGQVKEAAAAPARMFGSQRDRLMWRRIEEEQLSEWRRFVGDMSGEGEQAGTQGDAADGFDSSWLIGDSYADDSIQNPLYDNQPVILGDDADDWVPDAVPAGQWQAPANPAGTGPMRGTAATVPTVGEAPATGAAAGEAADGQAATASDDATDGKGGIGHYTPNEPIPDIGSLLD